MKRLIVGDKQLATFLVVMGHDFKRGVSGCLPCWNFVEDATLTWNVHCWVAGAKVVEESKLEFGIKEES